MQYDFDPVIIMFEYDIPAESFPTEQYSVSFLEPTFKDRLQAFKEFPIGAQCGYTVQEVLISRCLTKVNGSPIQPLGIDLIENIKQMPHKDYQHLLSTFMAVCQINDDDSALVKQVVTQYSKSIDAEVSISSDLMPSGEHSVRFLLPRVDSKIKCQSMWGDSNESELGYSFEELFCTYSLTSVDGQTVPNPQGVSKEKLLGYFYEFPLADVQFVVSVFLGLTAINRSEADTSIDLGKQLRANRKKKNKSHPATTTNSQSANSPKSKKQVDAT